MTEDPADRLHGAHLPAFEKRQERFQRLLRVYPSALGDSFLDQAQFPLLAFRLQRLDRLADRGVFYFHLLRLAEGDRSPADRVWHAKIALATRDNNVIVEDLFAPRAVHLGRVLQAVGITHKRRLSLEGIHRMRFRGMLYLYYLFLARHRLFLGVELPELL